MSMSAIAARVAAALLTSEKGRKGIGFLLVAIFAPVILIAAILCSATSGGADHNNSAVEASFYGVLPSVSSLSDIYDSRFSRIVLRTFCATDRRPFTPNTRKRVEVRFV